MDPSDDTIVSRKNNLTKRSHEERCQKALNFYHKGKDKKKSLNSFYRNEGNRIINTSRHARQSSSFLLSIRLFICKKFTAHFISAIFKIQHFDFKTHKFHSKIFSSLWKDSLKCLKIQIQEINEELKF